MCWPCFGSEITRALKPAAGADMVLDGAEETAPSRLRCRTCCCRPQASLVHRHNVWRLVSNSHDHMQRQKSARTQSSLVVKHTYVRPSPLVLADDMGETPDLSQHPCVVLETNPKPSLEYTLAAVVHWGGGLIVTMRTAKCASPPRKQSWQGIAS